MSVFRGRRSRANPYDRTMAMYRSDGLQNADEYRALTFRFTRFLIDTQVITPVERKITTSQLLDHFRTFQMIVPSVMKPADIVNSLYQNKLLIKRNAPDDPFAEIVLEFKTIAFVTINDSMPLMPPIDMERQQRSAMRIRITTNGGRIEEDYIRRGPAIEGLRCLICRRIFGSESNLEEHIRSDLHKFREMYRTARRKLTTEVRGLRIDHITCIMEKDVPSQCAICISNTSTNITFRIMKEVPLVDQCEVQTLAPLMKTIEPGETFEYKLSGCFSYYGTYEYPIVFVIKDVFTDCIHSLLSVATYKVLEEDLHDLCPISPYERDTRKWIVFGNAPVVHGPPLPASRHVLYKIPLAQYSIPSYLMKFLRHGFQSHASFSGDEESLLQKTKKLLLSGASRPELLSPKNMWNVENYEARFQLLLYLEEYQQKRSMLSFNREDAILRRGERGCWKLDVPGLHEGRPSILKGDSVFVWRVNSRQKFEGIVHDVHENDVTLAFDGTFNYYPNEKVGIEFQLNRLSIRVAHRALELIAREHLTPMMFPTGFNEAALASVVTRCYNKQIENNASQMTAVNNIVRDTAYPAPYIIYGPPGTGKTSTVVEAIAQLTLASEKRLKICACAPSNAAANLLATKILKHVPESQVYRLFSSSYDAHDIPIELRKCSNFSSERGDTPFPEHQIIESKAIIILTPVTAGRLHGVFEDGHFDYLFIDEAGQAEEPLTLIPVVGLLKRKLGKILGSLVLTGDPKQLGPIIHSRMAAVLGLDISMMERLMTTARPYQRMKSYNSNYITKLTSNYRSHPSLLHVPNQLFYDYELQSHADRSATDWFCLWDMLPTKNVPLIFHGVKGKDDREESSPSYFNLDEICRVGDYLTHLLGAKIKGRVVKQEDVVVLTPYNKQVKKFRMYLKKKKWGNVKVSSIEQFQGQENFVVILSCVRSRKEFLPSDHKFGLGFLRNPKRFNVAITRAKALLIIVGNPDVLQCDSNWKTLLDYCQDTGCYKGELPDGEVDPDPVETLRLDLSALATNDVPDSEKPSFSEDK